MFRMSNRIKVQMVGILCLALTAGLLSPITVYAQSTENSQQIVHKNTYMTLEDDTLEEDKYPSISLFSMETTAEDTLPAAYRSDQVSVNGVMKSYLPSAFKEQSPFGSCWAFSAIGACEASMIRRGYKENSFDLSERHLLYYFYNKGTTEDPKGGTWGDYNSVSPASSYAYVDNGGNSAYTMWHLASWCGPVEESAAPYSGLLSSATDAGGLCGQANSTQLAYGTDACHVQNVYKIALGNMDTDAAQKQIIKKLIMEYGALGIGYYSADSYDCAECDSYYNTSITATNHAVQVVGWDDDFPKDNYNTSAPGDGAWLIKNSWGEESNTFAQNGYFWISYYDASLNNYVSTATDGTTRIVEQYAYVYDAQPADNYDNIYQYDGDSASAYVTISGSQGTSEPIAHRFTAGEGNGKKELLRAVGIGVAQSNVSGTVRIYTNLTNETGDPTKGTLAYSQDFSLEYAGYNTIVLDKEIELEDNSQFSVVYYFDQTTAVNISYDYAGSDVKFVTYENEDVCFYYDGSQGWIDSTLGSVGWIARVKAYTDSVDSGSENTGTSDADGNSSETDTSDSDDSSSEDSSASDGSSSEDVSDSDSSLTESDSASDQTSDSDSADSEEGEDDVLEVTKPGKVTLSSVSLTSAGKAKLKWKSAAGASGYEIYRATSKNGKYKKAKTITKGTTLTATLLSCNGSKPYYYKVRAYKKSGDEKVYGSFSSIKTCGPSQVTFFKATLKSKNKVKLTWKKASNASGYQIYRATSLNGTYKKVKTITKKTTLTVLLQASTGSKPYYYKIRAYRTIKGKKVYGAFSEVKTCGPAQIKTIKIKALGSNKIKVAWKKTSNTTGYEIYRAASKNGTYKKIKTITKAKTVTYTNKSLKKGKKYYYKVRAYRTINGKKVYGPYSAVVSAKVK